MCELAAGARQAFYADDGGPVGFSGRVAVATGGGSGMRRLAALRLADQRAAVAVVDVDETGLETQLLGVATKMRTALSEQRRAFLAAGAPTAT